MDIKSPVAEARNEYTYSASGQKLKVVQKWNPNYYTTPVAGVGSAINTDSLTQSKTTEYIGNMIYENDVLKRILIDGGYIEGGVYYYYLTDHQDNNCVVVKDDGTIVQRNHHYPFGMIFGEIASIEQGLQPYKYNGKELDMMSGLNQYDYGARYYDPAITRFTTMDPLCEKYYSISPYVYCANNPVNAVDRDGRLVIFINGMHKPNDVGSKYWNNFDLAVMNHLNDYNSLYRDGSKESLGASGFFAYLSGTGAPIYRELNGRGQGRKDAANIVDLITDKNGKIKETIKIITHSMGAAYAKGYIESLLKYFEQHGIDPSVIEFEADFAPFQPTEQKAIKGIRTLQFSNYYDGVVNNWWFGSKRGDEQGVESTTDYDKNKGHAITDFWDKINSLPAGKYNVVNGQIVPEN